MVRDGKAMPMNKGESIDECEHISVVRVFSAFLTKPANAQCPDCRPSRALKRRVAATCCVCGSSNTVPAQPQRG